MLEGEGLVEMVMAAMKDLDREAENTRGFIMNEVMVDAGMREDIAHCQTRPLLKVPFESTRREKMCFIFSTAITLP